MPKELLAYLVQISKWGNGDLCFCQYDIVHSHERIYEDVVPNWWILVTFQSSVSAKRALHGIPMHNWTCTILP